MNDQPPRDGAPDLPELTEASIERIEKAVFAEIAAGAAPSPAPTHGRRRTRRRGWLTGIGVAAAFAAGVLVTPPLLSITSTTAGSSPEMTSFDSASSGGPVDMAVPEGVAQDAAAGAVTDVTGREIIATASATVRVDDIATASDAVADLAEEHGGYVESTNISQSAMSSDATMPAPDGEYGSMGIRVPAADLTTVISQLREIGAVVASSTAQQDVTSAAIDLRARIDATQASVDRLTELMSQSGSVADLIDAEVALTDRQAQLESYTQQLAALEDQVAMSSLQVQLTEQASVEPADPDGFTDGLLAGWNGLIVSLNALVIAVGFLLPWLAVAGVVGLIIWWVRRRRRRSTAPSEPH